MTISGRRGHSGFFSPPHSESASDPHWTKHVPALSLVETPPPISQAHSGSVSSSESKIRPPFRIIGRQHLTAFSPYASVDTPLRFPYSRFWRVGACGSNRGIHMLFSRCLLDLDEYKASPIVPTRVVGCTGCTVPINLRATLSCNRGVGHYPRGPPSIIAPRGDVPYIA